jgi:hypothetical protein
MMMIDCNWFSLLAATIFSISKAVRRLRFSIWLTTKTIAFRSGFETK